MLPFRDNIPSRTFPIVTILLILTNCAVFIYELSLGSRLPAFIFQFAVIPMRLQMPSSADAASLGAIDLFTSMFLHGGWLHLLGNMWFLWIFGDNVEDLLGHIRFLFFYLCCGIAGSLIHIFFNPGSTIPSIGASGAIAGVLGAYVVSFPFARVLTLIPIFLIWPIVELPAILVLGMWFLVQLLNGAAALDPRFGAHNPVAWWAHIGGFLAGIILLALLKRERPGWSRL